MNVFAVSHAPMVEAAGQDDPMALDLVAHFIGIVPHHNDNKAPRIAVIPKSNATPPETF